MKRDALERFEVKAQDWLTQAREAAVVICHKKGTVSSDDVLEAVGMPDGIHHNVIGAVFSKGFIRVGFRRTRRPRRLAHARSAPARELDTPLGPLRSWRAMGQRISDRARPGSLEA